MEAFVRCFEVDITEVILYGYFGCEEISYACKVMGHLESGWHRIWPVG